MSSKETDVLARIIEISRRLRAVHEALTPLTLDDDMKSEREASIQED